MLIYDVCVCVFCVCTINCPLLRLFCGNRDVTRTNMITISRSLSKLIIMCLFWQRFKLVCTENYFRIYTHKTDTKVIDRLTEISILLYMLITFLVSIMLINKTTQTDSMLYGKQPKATQNLKEKQKKEYYFKLNELDYS